MRERDLLSESCTTGGAARLPQKEASPSETLAIKGVGCLGSRIQWERPQRIAGTMLDETSENNRILMALTSPHLVQCES